MPTHFLETPDTDTSWPQRAVQSTPGDFKPPDQTERGCGVGQLRGDDLDMESSLVLKLCVEGASEQIRSVYRVLTHPRDQCAHSSLCGCEKLLITATIRAISFCNALLDRSPADVVQHDVVSRKQYRDGGSMFNGIPVRGPWKVLCNVPSYR